MWLARGRELPALVRVAVLRLRVLLAEVALALAERPRLVLLAEAAFSRLPVAVVALLLLRAVAPRALVLAVAVLRVRLGVSARATVVLPL